MKFFRLSVFILMVWMLMGCSDTLSVDPTDGCDLIEKGDIVWGTGQTSFEGVGVGDATLGLAGHTITVLGTDGKPTFTTDVVALLDLGVPGILFLMFEQPQPLPQAQDFNTYELYECR